MEILLEPSGNRMFRTHSTRQNPPESVSMCRNALSSCQDTQKPLENPGTSLKVLGLKRMLRNLPEHDGILEMQLLHTAQNGHYKPPEIVE